MRLIRALDNPLVTAAVGALASAAFVALRLAVVARGDITRFVFAGRDWVNPLRAPAGLHVYPGSGYDGQFYFRLALDPANLSHRAFGITLDQPFRIQRIGLSALSWLASAGQRALVPDAEVAVTLAALVVVAWLGGIIAVDAERHALWGLLVAGYWGFLFSIGRDLPEVVASAFLVGGLVALRRDRAILAGLLLGGAALTLETTLDVALAIGLFSVAQIALRRRPPSRRDLAWVVPGAAFVGWQLVGWSATGSIPMRSDAGNNLSAPGVDVVRGVGHFLAMLPSETALIWLGQFAVLTIVVAVAAWSVIASRTPAWEKMAWAIAVLVAVSLSAGIWEGTADFRGFEDVYVLSAIVALGSKRRLGLLGAVVGLAWAVTFAHRVVRL